MNNKNTLVFTTLLIALMALTLLPVQGFHHPSTTDDLNYENFGPRPEQVLMKIYGSYAAEYLAYKAQEIDLMDWPLEAGDVVELETTDPTHTTYNAVGYKDFGVWELDINDQQYPTDILSFRQALSYMIDKRYFINTYIGSTVAVKADSVLEHLDAWYNPYCDDLYNIVTRTTVVPVANDLPDFAAAYALLVDDLGPPVPDPEDPAYFTWLWPEKPVDPHGYINLPNHLLLFARSETPPRAFLGTFTKSTLEVDMPKALVAQGLPPARIHVDLYTVPRSECRREVMCEYRYHLYTGGWGLNRDPDFIAFGYASYQCWKPTCYSPNYPCYNNPLFDAAWDNAEAQPTATLAVPYVYEAQKIMMDDAAIIPVWLTAGYKAYLSKWDGVVSMAGRGPHNFWTLINAHLSSGTGHGDTLLYGYINDIASLNPIHASWVWDWYTMENIYDSMISFNPYDVAEDIPWMAGSWEVGTWDGGTKTKLTFHLRSDIVWQDVPAKADRSYDILPAGATGVPVTTKDVAFTVISIRDNLDAWNQFLVADVGKVEINDVVLGGAQMLRSYDSAAMDVYGLSSVPTQDVIVYYNLLSPWITLHWVGGLPIMPYHIWYWVPWWDYDADGTIDTWLFDPEIEDALYGSGPYIFDHRTPAIEILLKAFNIGTAYHGIVSTGEYMNSYARSNDPLSHVGLMLAKGSTPPYITVSNPTLVNKTVDVKINYVNDADVSVQITKHGVKVPAGGTAKISAELNGVNASLGGIVTLFAVQLGIRNVQPTYQGDVNCDGKVDIKDLVLLIKAFGTTEDSVSGRWNWNADVNSDAKVDVKDLVLTIKNFGKSIPQ
jgi:ABC-type transport system substrate-binding protein